MAWWFYICKYLSKCIELYILKGKFLLYVNYTSIDLTFKKKKGLSLLPKALIPNSLGEKKGMKGKHKKRVYAYEWCKNKAGSSSH